MTFSYTGTPAASPVDEIRFLTGDTAEPGLLSDEEITYFVTKLATTYSDAMMVAAFCADVIASHYAGEVSISADGVTYSGEQLQQKYQAVASQLRCSYKLIQGVGAAPFAGGTDVFETELLLAGTVPLNFGIGMLDNLRAGLQRYGYLGDLTLDDYDADLDPSNYQP